jgi:hypothetical protein
MLAAKFVACPELGYFQSATTASLSQSAFFCQIVVEFDNCFVFIFVLPLLVRFVFPPFIFVVLASYSKNGFANVMKFKSRPTSRASGRFATLRFAAFSARNHFPVSSATLVATRR